MTTRSAGEEDRRRRLKAALGRIDALMEQHPVIDLVVANAGIGGPTAPTAEYPLDGWAQVIGINLSGVFYCLQAVGRHDDLVAILNPSQEQRDLQTDGSV